MMTFCEGMCVHDAFTDPEQTKVRHNGEGKLNTNKGESEWSLYIHYIHLNKNVSPVTESRAHILLLIYLQHFLTVTQDVNSSG